MRDAEFSKTFVKLVPKLDVFFRTRMYSAAAKGDKALMSDDLIQLTALLALENSRKPEYAHYSVETLIKLKAKNVLSEYLDPPKKSLITIGMPASSNINCPGPDPLTRITSREDISRIHALSDDSTWQAIQWRAEGMEDQEIAIELDITEQNLRKKISRLRARIRAKWKNSGAL